MTADGEGAEPDQRGEHDQQEGRKDDVEAALEGVAEQGHRAVVRLAFHPTRGLMRALRMGPPVRREQQRVDSAEAPLEGVEVVCIFAEVYDPAIKKVPFLLLVRCQESDHVVTAGSFGFRCHGKGRFAGPCDQCGLASKAPGNRTFLTAER